MTVSFSKRQQRREKKKEKQIQFYFKMLTLNHEVQQLHASKGEKKKKVPYNKASYSNPRLGNKADV